MNVTELDTYCGTHEAHAWIGVVEPATGPEPVCLFAIRDVIGAIYPLTAPPQVAFALVMAALLDTGSQR